MVLLWLTLSIGFNWFLSLVTVAALENVDYLHEENMDQVPEQFAYICQRNSENIEFGSSSSGFFNNITWEGERGQVLQDIEFFS